MSRGDLVDEQVPDDEIEELLTMGGVEREILRVSRLCERATWAVAERGREYAEADAAYDKAFYRALLQHRATGAPEYECRAAGAAATDELNLARKIAETRWEAAREAGRNFRAQLDGLRTLCANLRPLVTDR